MVIEKCLHGKHFFVVILAYKPGRKRSIISNNTIEKNVILCYDIY